MRNTKDEEQDRSKKQEEDDDNDKVFKHEIWGSPCYNMAL